MTESHSRDHPEDAALVALLDGELSPGERAELAHRIASDPELQTRLLLLSAGNRPFRAAFERLLEEAPQARLEAMLRGLDPAPATPPVRAAPPRRWNGLSAVAAGLLLFLAGVGADQMVPTWTQDIRERIQPDTDDDWRQAVAEYLTLYTAETLASIPDDEAMRERELASVGTRMKLDLSPERVALPGLSFKRAQLFEYDGKPLGQIAYLDPASGPLALCIYPAEDTDAARQAEQRLGFNIVYWARNGHHFMLIGHAPASRLQELADDVSSRLSG